MIRTIIRAFVAEVSDPYSPHWTMTLHGAGRLPDDVIKEIAGGRVWVTFKRSIGEQEVIELARQRKAPELEAGKVDAARTVLEDLGGVLLDDEP